MSDMTIEEYEKIDPVITVEAENGEIYFNVPNQYTLGRVHSLDTKEPDTLEWIATFNADDVFYDIGANVGMYTIWAGATRRCRVFAFEPEAQNFAVLTKNIFLNELQQSVAAYPLAVSDRVGIGHLHLSTFLIGGSCHSFGEPLDIHLNPRNAKLRQGSYSATVDSLAESPDMDFPNHIKIDVDGIEHLIIAGAEKTLEDPRLRSVLVELNTNLDEHTDIIRRLQGLGFKLWQEKLEMSIRKSGDFEGVGNHIFLRG